MQTSAGGPGFVVISSVHFMNNSLLSIESAFQRMSVNRMYEPVHLAFTEGSTRTPSQEDVAAVIDVFGSS